MKTDTVDVFATPYRTREWDVLIQLFNITAAPRRVRFAAAANLVAGAEFFDHGTNAVLPGVEEAGYLSAETEVAPLASTVIRMRPARSSR